MQDMKQSISAALSSLYEFIYHRLALDGEEYDLAIERFKQEIEEKVDSSELLLDIENKRQSLLQLEGIQNRSELRTIQELLEEMGRIFKSLLPAKLLFKDSQDPIIPVRSYASEQDVIDAIKEFKLEEAELMPLLSRLNALGLLNHVAALAVIDKIPAQRVLEFCKLLPQPSINPVVALTAVRKATSQDIVELCRLLPPESIDREVASKAIKKRRKTHYVGLISPFTDISKKEILLKILESTLRNC